MSLGRVPGLSAVPCRASCPSTARSSGATRSTMPSSSCSGCWTACTRTWAPPRPRRGPAPPPRWVSPLSMSPCPLPQRGASAWCDRGQGPLCPPASFWQQQLSEAEPTPCTPWAAPSSRVSPHCFGVPMEPSACPGSLQHPWMQQIAAGAVSVALWLQSGACGGHFVLSLLLSEPIKQEEKLKHAFCHQAAAAQAAGWELGAQRAPETPWEKSAPASPTPKPAAGVMRGDTGWGHCGMQSADTGFGDILSQGCGGTTPVCPLCPGDRQEPLVTALWWD